MKDQKYTKGPWQVSRHASTYITDTTGRGIASSGGYQSSDMEQTDLENKANAKLIAAAPDLLEALQELLNVDEFDQIAFFTAQQKATRAIEKAIGNELV